MESKNTFSLIFIRISQVLLVPVYVVIWGLGKIVDGVVFVVEKCAYGINRFFRTIFSAVGRFFRFLFAKNKADTTKKNESDKKRSAASEIFLKIIGVVLFVAFLPMLAVIGVLSGVYSLFYLIGYGIKRLFSAKFGRHRAAKRERKEKDKTESAFIRSVKDFFYGIKITVSGYLTRYIFVFSEKHRENIAARRKKELRFVFLMLLFPLAQFALFWVYVNYQSILMAFKLEQNGEVFYTLENFRRFFVELKASTGVMGKLIENSVSFFPVSVFVTLPLSFVFSYFLYKRVPGAPVFRVIFYLPSIISAVSLTMLFRYIVSPTGPLSVLEKALNITPIDFLGSSKYAMKTVLFYTVWSGFGYNIVLLSSSMGRIPKELFESAKIDGAGTFREMVNIVLPLSYGTISTLITLSVANLFTVIGPVILLTSGQNNTNTIASFIYYKVKGGSENALSYASAVGLVFTAVGMPIVLIVRKVLSSLAENIEF